MDSGCTRQVEFSKQHSTNFKVLKCDSIMIADGIKLDLRGMGDIKPHILNSITLPL